MPTLLLIALATLVTEDLTCIATGVLVAQGKVTFLEGTMACLAGIFAGDILLFLSGRFGGRAALRCGPIAKLVSSQNVDRASVWLARRGMAVVFFSRFTPGLRLATYFAAGVLKTRFLAFTGYFLLAAAVWAPLLIGSTVVFGETVLRGAFGRSTLTFAIPFGVYAFFRLGLNFQTRRRVVGFIKRKFQWEFWPQSAAYLPLIPYLAWLALKHRSLTLFTAANPGMPSGGFVGESKSKILDHLGRAADAVAAWSLIPAALQHYAKIRGATDFMRQHDLAFPVVLKPDVGERGSGVAIVRCRAELEQYLRTAPGDIIVQEYVSGVEFGVFYYRIPGETRGRIFSITEKRFPEITGDGRGTIAELILRDPRAVCMAQAYLRASRRSVDEVLASGETVRLVELGSHCRGAVFLDATGLKTPALEEAVDSISQNHPGFFFGRFDVRAESVAAFQGGCFKVIELNGVSAEAAHIYDPSVSLLDAYRAMFTQWRVAFEIGALNRDRGEAPMPAATLIGLIRGRARETARSEFTPVLTGDQI